MYGCVSPSKTGSALLIFYVNLESRAFDYANYRSFLYTPFLILMHPYTPKHLIRKG